MKKIFSRCRKFFLFSIIFFGSLSLILSHAARSETGEQSIWCSINDPASERIFVSSPVRRPLTSHMAVMDYGSRFARTVNSRFGLHVVLVGNHCHAFPSSYRATTAYTALISRMADQNFKIVSVSIF